MFNGRVTLGDIELGGGDDMKLAISLWGKNLTNTQWEVFQFNTAGPGLANLTSVYWNEPRTYGVEARITF
jgi:iron complex outermembrane receptor protein